MLQPSVLKLLLACGEDPKRKVLYHSSCDLEDSVVDNALILQPDIIKVHTSGSNQITWLPEEKFSKNHARWCCVDANTRTLALLQQGSRQLSQATFCCSITGTYIFYMSILCGQRLSSWELHYLSPPMGQSWLSLTRDTNTWVHVYGCLQKTLPTWNGMQAMNATGKGWWLFGQIISNLHLLTVKKKLTPQSEEYLCLQNQHHPCWIYGLLSVACS
jgi:hypothetical protein